MKTWIGEQIRRPWALLVMLVAAVLVPSVGALWLMREAMRNEGLAIQEKLRQAHAFEAEQAAQRLDIWLGTILERAKEGPEEPAEFFAWVVREAIADAGLKVDIRTSRLRYPPAEAETLPGAPDAADWRPAERAEFEERDLKAAATHYARIAASTAGAERLRARLAEARTREAPPNHGESLKLLHETFTPETFLSAPSMEEKSLVLSGLYRIFELTPEGEDRDAALDALKIALSDYREPGVPAAQRTLLLRDPALDGDSLAGRLRLAESLAGNLAGKAIGAPEVPDAFYPAPADWLYMARLGPQSAAPEREPEHRDTYRLLLLDMQTLRRQAEAAVYGPMETRIAQHQKMPPYHLELRSNDAPPALNILELEVRSARLPSMQWVVSFSKPWRENARAEGILFYVAITAQLLCCAAALALFAGYHIFHQVRLAGLKNELISVIAHELKTPLASMRILVETLRAGRAGGEREQQEYLDLIARENLRLSHLVENFLTFSRLEQGRKVFHRERLDAAEVLHQAVDVASDRFAAPGCSLSLEIPRELPPIRGDRDALVTVLLNLLDNAWKYTGAEKRVIVRALPQHDGLRVYVQDNGIGLNRRAIRRVFDRFYQEDRSLTGHAGGCGLGLSIVRFIVEAHGGSVMAESEPGKGSTFSFQLPADKEAP